MSRQTVFITRIVPQKGLDLIVNEPDIEADIWPEELPPPREVLLAKVRGLDGLYCLLTEKIDGNCSTLPGRSSKWLA